MKLLPLLALGLVAPLAGLAAPAGDLPYEDGLMKRENLCSLKSPPALCKPDDSVTVDEIALRAYKFYRAFVVDGDPRVMFSYIDSTYKVSPQSNSISIGPCCIVLKGGQATPPGLRRRTGYHLVSVLQRAEDWKRGQHGLVLRRQQQHVVRTVQHN